MSIEAKHKQKYLSSVSHATLRFGCAAAAVARAERGQFGVLKYGVEGFLIWLRIWLNWLSGEKVPGSSYSTRGEARKVNRYRRRVRKHTMPIVRRRSPLYYLCGRGLSPTQFLERECALSIHGRISVYGLRYSGSVLQRRALLICYDHGWWRAPIGIFGRVYCGIWYVHVWPGWQKLIEDEVKKSRAFRPGIRFPHV